MERIASIDIYRALIMLLMIFVDDLWTLHGVPHWLEHTAYNEDGMGLADTIFPAFLFIVGLSIPLAVNSRISKGESKPSIWLHIIERALALIAMGFFFVNQEYIRPDVTFFERNIRTAVMVVAFILIWNNYGKAKTLAKIPVQVLQSIGIFMLLALAVMYKGGTIENPQWMSPHWWGILGIIGWTYLLCSLIYLVAGNRIWIIAPVLIIFHLLNAQEFRVLPYAGIRGFRFVIGASNYALVMSGILATLIFIKLNNARLKFLFPLLLFVPATVSLVYGFSTRPLWGISKILGTPSWTAICAGISFISFALVYVLSDIFNLHRWVKFIMPAGRSTLTCYLLPVFVYSLFIPQLTSLPPYLTAGSTGILKSLLFALTIVIMTGGLEKIKIRIKL